MKTSRRFRFRFGLRTLLLTMLLIAPFAALAGQTLYERDREMATIKAFADSSGQQFKLVRGGELEVFSIK